MADDRELVSPAYYSMPDYAYTLGGDVAEVAELAGFTPDLEQRLWLDGVFARDGNDLAATLEVAIIASRQNIKTAAIEMAELGWLFVTDQRLIVHTAHEFSTTQESFRHMCELIEGAPDLDRRVRSIYRGNGDESIELFNKCRIIYKARTASGGRGLTGDKVILDEGMFLRPAHMGTLMPTLSARPDPQIVYGSSAGLSDSDVLRAIRDRGRKGGDPSLFYAEWCDDLPPLRKPTGLDRGVCADPKCLHATDAVGCALDDQARWARSNPTMGRRITVRYIAAERRTMPPAEFGRERLGWWDEDTAVASMFPADAWRLCYVDPDSAAPTNITGPPSFALDVAPDHSSAAIVAAGRSTLGGWHVEITGQAGDPDDKPDVDWVVARLADMASRWRGMVVHMAAGSAAESLRPALEAAGVSTELFSGAQVSAACGLFYTQALTGGLHHIGQPTLDAAVAGARRRDIGDGAWSFGKRKSTAVIASLFAASLALYAASDGSSAARDVLANIH